MTDLAPSPRVETGVRRATDTRTVVWADEAALSARRLQLRLDDDISAPISRVALGDRAAVLRGLPVAANLRWALYPVITEPSAEPARLLQGRIEQVTAVTAAHRHLGHNQWQPIASETHTRTVAATDALDPARSVWIPSGQPVLIGFLIVVNDTRISDPVSRLPAPALR